jgi:hypothetical protein
LREEHRLRVFENRVLRKIFGPKREEEGSWRKLRNDELHNLYYSPNIVKVIKSRRMKWAVLVAHMGEGRGVYRVLFGTPEGKRPLGRPRRRWEDNIKLDRRERGIELDSAGSRWSPVAGFCEHSNELTGVINKSGYFMTSGLTIRFSKKYPTPSSK